VTAKRANAELSAVRGLIALVVMHLLFFALLAPPLPVCVVRAPHSSPAFLRQHLTAVASAGAAVQACIHSLECLLSRQPVDRFLEPAGQSPVDAATGHATLSATRPGWYLPVFKPFAAVGVNPVDNVGPQAVLAQANAAFLLLTLKNTKLLHTQLVHVPLPRIAALAGRRAQRRSVHRVTGQDGAGDNGHTSSEASGGGAAAAAVTATLASGSERDDHDVCSSGGGSGGQRSSGSDSGGGHDAGGSGGVGAEEEDGGAVHFSMGEPLVVDFLGLNRRVQKGELVLQRAVGRAAMVATEQSTLAAARYRKLRGQSTTNNSNTSKGPGSEGGRPLAVATAKTGFRVVGGLPAGLYTAVLTIKVVEPRAASDGSIQQQRQQGDWQQEFQWEDSVEDEDGRDGGGEGGRSAEAELTTPAYDTAGVISSSEERPKSTTMVTKGWQHYAAACETPSFHPNSGGGRATLLPCAVVDFSVGIHHDPDSVVAEALQFERPPHVPPTAGDPARVLPSMVLGERGSDGGGAARAAAAAAAAATATAVAVAAAAAAATAVAAAKAAAATAEAAAAIAEGRIPDPVTPGAGYAVDNAAAPTPDFSVAALALSTTASAAPAPAALPPPVPTPPTVTWMDTNLRVPISEWRDAVDAILVERGAAWDAHIGERLQRHHQQQHSLSADGTDNDDETAALQQCLGRYTGQPVLDGVEYIHESKRVTIRRVEVGEGKVRSCCGGRGRGTETARAADRARGAFKWVVSRCLLAVIQILALARPLECTPDTDTHRYTHTHTHTHTHTQQKPTHTTHVHVHTHTHTHLHSRSAGTSCALVETPPPPPPL
jgi:hypothetical protein